MYLIYKTDSWHSYASRDLIGITENLSQVIDICNEKAKKEGDSIDEEQQFNLTNIQQTQGYSGEGEFSYEDVETDILL